MASSNPLISIDGFRYVFEQITNPENSNETISRLVDSLYSPVSFTPITALSRQESLDLKRLRKDFQYQGILQLLTILGVKDTRNLAEFCCGNGELARFLAEKLELQVLALDVNFDLIEKDKRGTNPRNLSFVHQDVYACQTRMTADTYVALHSCGRLLDRVIELAASDKQNSRIVAAPCCYGKINNHSRVLPRSRRFQAKEKLYLEVLKKAMRFEGLAGNHPGARSDIILEALRRLVDMDRVFYLQEQGYEADFARMSPRSFRTQEKEYPLSPANAAIVASR